MLAALALFASLRQWSASELPTSRILSRVGLGLAVWGLALILAGLYGWQTQRAEALAAEEVALVADAAAGAACTGRPASEPRCIAALATMGWARWTQTQADAASARWLGVVGVGILL